MLRWTVPGDPTHLLIRSAVIALRDTGDDVCVCHQNLTELHAVATRPISANGLGMSSAPARRLGMAIEASFPFLPDSSEVHTHWARLLEQHEVMGRQAFDARLVAVMLANGVSNLLTLDPRHFSQFSEVVVMTPGDVLRSLQAETP